MRRDNSYVSRTILIKSLQIWNADSNGSTQLSVRKNVCCEERMRIFLACENITKYGFLASYSNLKFYIFRQIESF